MNKKFYETLNKKNCFVPQYYSLYKMKTINDSSEYYVIFEPTDRYIDRIYLLDIFNDSIEIKYANWDMADDVYFSNSDEEDEFGHDNYSSIEYLELVDLNQFVIKNINQLKSGSVIYKDKKYTIHHLGEYRDSRNDVDMIFGRRCYKYDNFGKFIFSLFEIAEPIELKLLTLEFLENQNSILLDKVFQLELELATVLEFLNTTEEFKKYKRKVRK